MCVYIYGIFGLVVVVVFCVVVHLVQWCSGAFGGGVPGYIMIYN